MNNSQIKNSVFIRLNNWKNMIFLTFQAKIKLADVFTRFYVPDLRFKLIYYYRNGSVETFGAFPR